MQRSGISDVKCTRKLYILSNMSAKMVCGTVNLFLNFSLLSYSSQKNQTLFENITFIDSSQKPVGAIAIITFT